MPRVSVLALNGDVLELDNFWLPILYSRIPLNLMIHSKEAMDELIRYAKEKDSITRRWATIKTHGKRLNIAAIEARSTGAGIPVGVTADALIAALDRDFVRDRDPVLLEQIGWAASRFRMLSLARACYEQFRRDGMSEQQARAILNYYQ